MEEREKRKIIAEEKHKEWVQKKNEQVKRNTNVHTLHLYNVFLPPHYLRLVIFSFCF